MDRKRTGAALIISFMLMLVLSGLALGVGMLSHNSVVSGSTYLLDQQAAFLAEAGWQRARQQLAAGAWSAAVSPGNTYTETFGPGTYQVTIVDNSNGTYSITSDGYVPNTSAPRARRRRGESSLAVNSTSTNQSLAATASASSSQGGNTPEKANDGNTGTRWRAGTAGSNEWLAMDYGASKKTLERIVILEREAIDGLTIEISCDASAWGSVPGLSVVESPAKTWTATFPAVRQRYFRARFTSVPAGQQASVEEMRSFSPQYDFGSVTASW